MRKTIYDEKTYRYRGAGLRFLCPRWPNRAMFLPAKCTRKPRPKLRETKLKIEKVPRTVVCRRRYRQFYTTNLSETRSHCARVNEAQYVRYYFVRSIFQQSNSLFEELIFFDPLENGRFFRFSKRLCRMPIKYVFQNVSDSIRFD